ARASGAGLENPIVALSRILSSTRVTHRIARDLYDREHPDLLALYFEGTDEIGHVFALATPPKLACAPEAEIAKYGGAVARYYAEVDRLLGQWMRRAEEDGATLIVHSDHGFKWGDDRPCGLAPGSWTTAAFWHRLQGVFGVWGARVRRAEARGDAGLFDVAPTVLALLGLPPDRRMPGRAARFAFSDLPPVSDTAKNTPGAIEVRRVSAQPMSPAEANEYAKKLLALGYLSGGETRPLAPTGGDRPGMTEGAWNNLGLYLRDTAKKPAEAKAAFLQSLALRPDYYSPMYNLAVLARSEGRRKEAEDWLLRSLAALKTDPATALAAWARDYDKEGKTSAALSLLERAARSYPESEGVARELARAKYRSRDCTGAAAALSRFDAATTDPRTLNDLALFATCRADREAVMRFLERSLALDPNQPEVARTLSKVRSAAS
nr:alkaline phosphatase family protein [Acidobacteriota bacterium]